MVIDCYHQKVVDCPRIRHCLDCDCPIFGDPRKYGHHTGDDGCPMDGDRPG